MSFSKQDELLQKLQKCVGRLQNKTPNTQRSIPPQNQRYIPPDLSRNREHKQQYNFRQSSMEPSRQINNRTNYQSNRPRWNNKNYETEYFTQGRNEQKNYSKNTTTTNYGQDNLIQRSHQNIQSNTRMKDQYRRRPLEQTRNKYQDQSKYSIGQPKKRPVSYLQMNDSQRAPLREYDLNNTSTTSHMNKPTIQKRQPRRYLQQNILETNNQEVSTPKYQSHRKQEIIPSKTQGYRRNSVSHSISQNQNLNRTAQKQDSGFYKNFDFSSKMEKYQPKDKENFNLSSIKPFNSNMRTVSNKEQTRGKVETIQQGYTSTRESHTRQLSQRQKNRNIGVGSISSVIKRNQLQSSCINYQSFQMRQQGQQRQLNLKKILEEVGNTNQDTFTKLQKISELNERINKRIKNIIQTFQNK